jgi:hypothetical protein
VHVLAVLVAIPPPTQQEGHQAITDRDIDEHEAAFAESHRRVSYKAHWVVHVLKGVHHDDDVEVALGQVYKLDGTDVDTVSAGDAPCGRSPIDSKSSCAALIGQFYQETDASPDI